MKTKGQVLRKFQGSADRVCPVSKMNHIKNPLVY